MRCEFYVLLASLVLPQLSAQQLPTPVLAYQGSTDNGSGFTQYKFAITNYSDYPSELFQHAPDLPPCGRNRDASRTWVDILDPTGARIYGFCALQSPAELGRLWFAWRTGTAPPKSIRVVLTDRRTGRTVEGQLTLQAAGATGTDQAPAALRVTEEGGFLSYEVTNLSPYTITGYEVSTRFQSGGAEALGCGVSVAVKTPAELTIQRVCRLPVDSSTGKPVSYSSRLTSVRFANGMVWNPPGESEKP